MLISDSPDYTDAYIVLKGSKKLTFKNNGFFLDAYQKSITHL